MNILITGHKGFIGSKLLDKLPGALGVDLKEGYDILTCDLPKDIDVVYHLAAQTSVEASWHDPVHDADNLRLIVRIVKEYPNAKIIYANSCAAVAPKSPYGFSKWASGEYLYRFHNNWVSLVFPNIYGGSKQSVVDIFNGREEVTVFGDGTHVRDYVHVDDLVDGLVKAMAWPKGEYFMGSEKGTTVLELAKGKKIIFGPERKEESEVIVPNTTPNWKPIIKVMDFIK